MDTKKLHDAEPEDILDELDKEEDTVWTYTLRKPVSYNGETFTELHFDFENLSGKTILQIDRELQRLGLAAAAPEFSTDFQIRIAMRACKEPVGSDFFDMLGAKDFMRIRSRARGFLMR